jgi:hypothetical protein
MVTQTPIKDGTNNTDRLQFKGYLWYILLCWILQLTKFYAFCAKIKLTKNLKRVYFIMKIESTRISMLDIDQDFY